MKTSVQKLKLKRISLVLTMLGGWVCPLGLIAAERDYSANADQLPEVTVEAEREKLLGERLYPDEGYISRGATVGSRVETSMKDIPQSITVINNELLRDISTARINQLADYVAGVQPFASAATPYTNAFFFRGFGSVSSTTFNGFRESGFLTSNALINIERIEFLKGPASVLYGGSAGLSGLVNYVSKQPQATPFHEITVGAGSFDRVFTTLDTTDALTEDGSLRYRLTAAVDKDGNHKDDFDQQSTFISPYLSWDITDNTRLDVEFIAQNTEFDGRENPLPRHPVSFRLPVETNLGRGGEGADQRRVTRIDLKHRFDNGITFRQGLYSSTMDKTKDLSFQFGINPDGVTGPRRVRFVPENERDLASQTELWGTFTTGIFAHDWLVGMELRKSKFSYEFSTAPANNVNLFNPQEGMQTGPFTLCCADRTHVSSRGYYFQDLIDLTHGFKLMLGGRYDEVEQSTRPKGGVAEPGNDRTEHAFSPRVGLIYQSTPATAFYGSYTQSFSPQFGRSRTGSGFDPQEGEQVEIGVKHDIRPDLSLTAAVFNYRRENVRTADPVDDNFSIAVGEQESKGFELELAGQVTADYSLFANYAYIDAKVTEDNVLPEGDRLAGVPRHSMGIFNKLRLTRFGLPNWSGIVGVVYNSERESGLPNDTAQFSSSELRIPSYTQLDIGLIYETPKYTFRLTGTNLTDEEIYDSTGSGLLTRPPRSALASLSVRF